MYRRPWIHLLIAGALLFQGLATAWATPTMHAAVPAAAQDQAPCHGDPTSEALDVFCCAGDPCDCTAVCGHGVLLTGGRAPDWAASPRRLEPYPAGAAKPPYNIALLRPPIVLSI